MLPSVPNWSRVALPRGHGCVAQIARAFAHLAALQRMRQGLRPTELVRSPVYDSVGAKQHPRTPEVTCRLSREIGAFCLLIVIEAGMR